MQGVHTMAETVTIANLILANHAEAINGLLYISGGGWSDHHRAIAPDGPPPVSHMGLGLSIAVPWNETNRDHTLHIQLEDDDATTIMMQADMRFNVGRPPQLPPGAEQHAVVAIPLDIIFPHQGGYRFVLTLDGEGDVRAWTFRVHDNVKPPTVRAATL